MSYTSFNSLLDIPTISKNQATVLLSSLFNSFKNDNILIKPVSYNVDCYPNKMIFNIMFYAPPTNWYTHFNDEYEFGDQVFSLPFPHRYFIVNFETRKDITNQYKIESSHISHDFVSFKNPEENIYKYISSVPLSNHYNLSVCTAYSLGPRAKSSMYSDCQDLFSEFFSSNYNTDYVNLSLHSNKTAYLLLKYLDFSISDAPISDDMFIIADTAKHSSDFPTYINNLTRLRRCSYQTYYSHLYYNFLTTWSNTPTIWSDIPQKEYRMHGYRDTRFRSYSLKRTGYLYSTNKFFNNPLIHNLDDLISTLY
jgi:hypothetical protein